MALAVKLTFNDVKARKLINKLPQELVKEGGNAVFSYAQLIARKLRQAAITDPLRPITPNRQSAAMRINARKLSKERSVVKMPLSLVMLDSMTPHFVSLKRGRNITKWARKNFGNATITGRSMVGRGPRGGITPFVRLNDGSVRRSALFVTPHKFVQPTLNKERNKLPNELRKGINKAFKSAAT